MIRNTLQLVLGLTVAASAAPLTAQAGDCFILVHGHMQGNAALDNADINGPQALGYNYWRTANDGNFITSVTQNGAANHGVVRWNAGNAGKAYWQTDVLQSVVAQILSITAGTGDTYTHAGQCAASDRFFLVAHSQGAQVISYINANAYPGAKFYNKGINTADAVTLSSTMSTSVSTTAIPFDAAMSKISAVLTVGGAINGTSLMEVVCSNGPQAALAQAVTGQTCAPSLQTFAQYNPSSYTGASMLKPVYHFGGTASFSLPNMATSAILGGEDDGTVSLASQMNCNGSPSRDLESNLRAYYFGTILNFTCDNGNKRHSNTFNVGTFDQHHESERGTKSGTVARDLNAATSMTCGNGLDISRSIPACIAAGSI